MLMDCALKEPSTGNDKLVWVVIILFAQVLVAALYLLVRRPRRLVEVGDDYESKVLSGFGLPKHCR